MIDYKDYALSQILKELEYAIEKHPVFPLDVIHQAAIMAEESGEVVQAANDYVYNDHIKGNPIFTNGDEFLQRDHLFREYAQTAAVCIRSMMALCNDEAHRIKSVK